MIGATLKLDIKNQRKKQNSGTKGLSQKDQYITMVKIRSTKEIKSAFF